MDIFAAISDLSERHWIAIAAGLAAVLVVEALYLVFSDARSQRQRINRRMIRVPTGLEQAPDDRDRRIRSNRETVRMISKCR